MREYILNEKEYIENFVKDKTKEKNLKIRKHITMMAKYYRDLSYEKIKENNCESIDILNDRKRFCRDEIEKVLKVKMEEYVRDKWISVIDKNINIAFNLNAPLRETQKIGITKKEFNTIMAIGESPGSREKKKCLLTLIVLAKFKNPNNPSQAVIDETKNEIFQLANMKSIKSKKKNECDSLNTNIKSTY